MMTQFTWTITGIANVQQTLKVRHAHGSVTSSTMNRRLKEGGIWQLNLKLIATKSPTLEMRKVSAHVPAIWNQVRGIVNGGSTRRCNGMLQCLTHGLRVSHLRDR